MYTTRTKPWVRAPPHRELKIAAPVQLCPETCLSHLVTPLANLLDYRKLTVISMILEVFENMCYNVTWDLGTDSSVNV